jgi:hypothetical protein
MPAEKDPPSPLPPRAWGDMRKKCGRVSLGADTAALLAFDPNITTLCLVLANCCLEPAR